MGITHLYYSFLKYLVKQKEKIAFLQLTGRIEDFLVKEFIYFVHKKGQFAITNVGNKGQQKVDICLLKGNMASPKIYGMIEAKYVRNIHRAWASNATDEVVTTLKELKKQLHAFENPRHGSFSVNLVSKSRNIYGMVFASYARKKEETDMGHNFYKAILDKATGNFRYHDLPKPYFRPIFDNVKVKIFNSTFYVTLKCGLWKRI